MCHVYILFMSPGSFCHSSQTEEGHPVGTSHHLSDHQSRCRIASYAHPGLAEACRFVYNDAKFVNERARNDIILLSRYFVLSVCLIQINCFHVYEPISLSFIK